MEAVTKTSCRPVGTRRNDDFLKNWRESCPLRRVVDEIVGEHIGSLPSLGPLRYFGEQRLSRLQICRCTQIANPRESVLRFIKHGRSPCICFLATLALQQEGSAGKL